MESAKEAGAEGVEAHVGRVVHEVRVKKGWTLKTLAKLTGYGTSTIGNMESGRAASQAVVQRCCDALGMMLPVGFEQLPPGAGPYKARRGAPSRKPAPKASEQATPKAVAEKAAATAKGKLGGAATAEKPGVVRVHEQKVVLGPILDPSELANTSESMRPVTLREAATALGDAKHKRDALFSVIRLACDGVLTAEAATEAIRKLTGV